MVEVRTLIVDDPSVMRKVMQRALRLAGLPLGHILEAANGAEALKLLEEQDVDLILCDINMPIMDGLEFVGQLATSRHEPNIPVIMVTTEGCEQQVITAIARGARGYIRKPFTPEQVRDHILPVIS